MFTAAIQTSNDRAYILGAVTLASINTEAIIGQDTTNALGRLRSRPIN